MRFPSHTVRASALLPFALRIFAVPICAFALGALLLPERAEAQAGCTTTGSVVTCSSSGGITVSSTFGASVGSSTSVSGLAGTVTSISLTLNNLNVTYLNSVAMVLVPPSGSGLTPLDFLSGACNSSASTFTVADTGATGTDNNSGLIPTPGIGTCPGVLSGTYLPTDYYPGQDIFNPPGPSTYNSAGTNPSTDGSGTFNFSSFGANASTLNGTWTLYIANEAGSPAPSGSLGSWSISFTGNFSSGTATTTSISANPDGSTSLVYTGSNVAGQTTTATPVALTATVSPNPGGGTVTFYDSTGTIAGSGTVLAASVAVNGSGQAQQIVTFPGTEEGARAISAVFNGSSGFAESISSQATVLTTNHPYNPSGATFCNGPITINNDTGGSPYPSLLALGTSFSQLQGSIQSVSVSLNDISLQNGLNLDNLGFLLQAPGSNTTGLGSSGNAFEFLSWAGNPLSSGLLTLSDAGTSTIPYNMAASCATCVPTDNWIDIGSSNPDTFPFPAPSVFVSAAPTGAATFATEFGGQAANNTWSLYVDNRLNQSGTLGQIGSWCLNFTMQANAHPTTTSVSGSPNPASTAPGGSASVSLTASVSVTDGSGLTVNAGTVSFVDGSTNLGSAAVSNGQAILSTALAEGTHQIVATYSGTTSGTEFASTSGTYDQRVDAQTTHPTAGSGAGPYTYCNAGSITIPGLGATAGPAGPYPSNIFVTNLPGTVSATTVTLNSFSTKDQGDLLALLVGPGGTYLDFFSLTGSSATTAPTINLTFSDTASSLVTGNLSSSGSFKPTSLNGGSKATTYPQCPPNASGCANPPVGPPLPTNPFKPALTNVAATAGTGILGNPNEAGAFGGTSSSTYNGNGTWSLYLNDGGPSGAGQVSTVGNWCVGLTVNQPSVTVVKSHTATFTQGEQGASFTVNITNNGNGPTGDPTGGRSPMTVTDTLNSAFSYAGFSGTGWSCSATGQTVTCANDSAVAQGNSYAPLTINVNVSPSASGTITNNVQAIGAGAKSATSNTDSVTISPAPALAIQKSHTGTFTQGQTAQWTITVSNTAAGSLTYGTITVLDTMPPGYELDSYSSGGSAAWSCSGGNAVVCTTTEGIAGGAASVINLIVDVPVSSPSTVTNVASAFGGGDLVHVNAGSAVSGADTVSVVQVQPAPTIISYNVLFGSESFGLIGSTRNRLPWEITGIQVVFSQPISAANINSLTGVTTTGFSGLGTSTLTWSVTPIPIGAFSTTLLATGPNAIKGTSGNAINGGTNFTQNFKVLWGDFNDDGVVDASDLVLVNAARSAPYNIFADMNGDGVVNATDVSIVRSRIGTSQP
jgi:Bacterial Ig-like domain (group 3)/Dockerin type I domain